MAIAKSRHEYKFSVNEKDLLMLGMRLAPLIAKDAHVGEQGYYHIRSVYFDDYHNNSFYSNEAGRLPNGICRHSCFWNTPRKMIST